MPVSSIRGKSLKAMAYDIADGYVTVNPLFLKPLDIDSLTGTISRDNTSTDSYQGRED